MQKASSCPACGHSNVYCSDEVSAGGGYAPNYLPGLGTFFSTAKFTMLVCKDCGLTRFYASKEALAKLPDSAKWHKV